MMTYNGPGVNMRTTLDIPEDLLRAVTEIVGVKKRNEAVRIALSDFTRRKRREQLLALRGRLAIEDVTGDMEDAEIADAQGRH
jgi:Arc/MetJ family transcription regulator